MSRLPARPAASVPMMFVAPMREIAAAPSAPVVVIPIPASTPPGSIGPHSSVTKAGKCAVTNPSR